MGDNFMNTIAAIATSIIGVAIVAVIVSKNAQTGSVISAAGQAFEGILGVAVSPVTGGSSGGSSGGGGGGSSSTSSILSTLGVGQSPLSMLSGSGASGLLGDFG
jgi:hypothetical protein